MLRQIFFSCILISIAVNQVSAQQDASSKNSFGGTPFHRVKLFGHDAKVPIPGNLILATDKMGWFVETVGKASPNTKVSAVFADPSTDFQLAPILGLRRAVDIQTHPMTRGQITPKLFEFLKGKIEDQFLKKTFLTEGVRDRVENNIGKNIDETKGKRILIKTKNTIAFFVPMVVDGKKRATVSCMIRWKKSLFQANFHSENSSDKDEEWVCKTAKKWADDFKRINSEARPSQKLVPVFANQK